MTTDHPTASGTARSCRCAPSTRRPRCASTRTGRPARLRRPDQRRRAAPRDHPRALAHPGEREAARQPGRRPARAPRRVPRRPRRPATSPRRPGSRSGACSSSSGRLIAWWHIPGTARLERAGRRGRAAERSPADAQAGPGDPQGARHDPGAVPGRAGRRRRGHGARSRRGGAWALAAVALFARVRAGRAAAGQDDHDQGRAARAGAAAGPGT